MGIMIVGSAIVGLGPSLRGISHSYSLESVTWWKMKPATSSFSAASAGVAEASATAITPIHVDPEAVIRSLPLSLLHPLGALVLSEQVPDLQPLQWEVRTKKAVYEGHRPGAATSNRRRRSQ